MHFRFYATLPFFTEEKLIEEFFDVRKFQIRVLERSNIVVVCKNVFDFDFWKVGVYLFAVLFCIRCSVYGLQYRLVRYTK